MKTLKNILLATAAGAAVALSTGCASVSQRGYWQKESVPEAQELSFWQNREDALGYLTRENAQDPVYRAGKTMANAWYHDRVKPFKAIANGEVLSGVWGVLVNPLNALTGTVDATYLTTFGSVQKFARGGNPGDETNELRAKIIDNIFVPTNVLIRQVDGKSEKNLFNQTSRLWGKYDEAQRVPLHLSVTDGFLEAAKLYLLFDCAKNYGKESDKAIPFKKKHHGSTTGGDD